MAILADSDQLKKKINDLETHLRKSEPEKQHLKVILLCI